VNLLKSYSDDGEIIFEFDEVTADAAGKTISEGGRNAALMSHLGKLRYEGASESELLAAAFEFNKKYCVLPLDPAEVTQVAQNAAQYAVGVPPVDVAVDELNKTHAIVTIGSRVYVLIEQKDDFSLVRPSELRTLYANRFCTSRKGAIVNVADAWLKHTRRREHSQIVFEPGGTTTEKAWNLWRGWGVDPKAGDCSLFLQHVQTPCALEMNSSIVGLWPGSPIYSRILAASRGLP
jgi:hypothetical protein